MEINDKSFENITSDTSISALLIVATKLLTDINDFLKSGSGGPAARKLLERGQAIITLLSHDLWLNIDDWK